MLETAESNFTHDKPLANPERQRCVHRSSSPVELQSWICKAWVGCRQHEKGIVNANGERERSTEHDLVKPVLKTGTENGDT